VLNWPAQREQIEMDRAMATEYEDQHNNEIALRGRWNLIKGNLMEHNMMLLEGYLHYNFHLHCHLLHCNLHCNFHLHCHLLHCNFHLHCHLLHHKVHCHHHLMYCNLHHYHHLFHHPTTCHLQGHCHQHMLLSGTTTEAFTLDPMNVKCQHCHALHFYCEKLSKSTKAVPKFRKFACLEGQISCHHFQPGLHAALRDLLCGKSPLSKEFKANIRQYNSAFAFTSVGVDVDEAVHMDKGQYSFHIQGDLHHNAGGILPPPG